MAVFFGLLPLPFPSVGVEKASAFRGFGLEGLKEGHLQGTLGL